MSLASKQTYKRLYEIPYLDRGEHVQVKSNDSKMAPPRIDGTSNKPRFYLLTLSSSIVVTRNKYDIYNL